MNLEIKGLREALGVDKDWAKEVAKAREEGAKKLAWQRATLVATGQQPTHGVNRKATAKRRAANKVARQQRKINRG